MTYFWVENVSGVSVVQGSTWQWAGPGREALCGVVKTGVLSSSGTQREGGGKKKAEAPERMSEASAVSAAAAAAAAAAPPALPARTGACAAAAAAAAATDKLREDLVSNAVQFLRHPNVVGTPLARRVAFLKRKGLTGSEIDAAVRRAAAAASEAGSAAPSSVSVVVAPTAAAAAAPTPFWGSWKGAVCTALMAAGIGCGAALVYDFYLKPWWQRRHAAAEGTAEDSAAAADEEDAQTRQSTEEMLETIRKNQAEMLSSIAELTAALNALQKQ